MNDDLFDEHPKAALFSDAEFFMEDKRLRGSQNQF
jgi:hypothetical protein